MQQHPDRYPWIRRRPGVRIDDLFLHATAGEDTGPVRRFLERWLRRVLRRAAEPIRIESTPEGRRVTCLGVLRFTLGPVRPGQWMTVEMREWSWDPEHERWGLFWGDWDPFEPLRLHPRPPSFWMNLLHPWRGLGQQLPNSDWERLRAWSAHPPFAWLDAWIDQSQLQQQLVAALGFDAEVCRIAADLNRYESVDAWDCTVIAPHRDWFLRLQADAPQLLSLGYALRAGGAPLDPDLEPVAAIRSHLRARGLLPKGWVLLCRVPDADSRLGYLCADWGSVDSLVPYLNAHVRAGLDTLAGWAFLLALDGLDPADGLTEPVLRILLREAVATEARGSLEAWLETDGRRINRWSWNHRGFTPDPNQARAGWPWLRRQLLAAERKWLLAQELAQPYALREYRQGCWTARALETVPSVRAEGAEMGHCLAHLNTECEYRVDRFADGHARYFSLRDARTHARVATLEIERCEDDAGWQVAECRGPADQPVADPVVAFARSLAHAYAAAETPERAAA